MSENKNDIFGNLDNYEEIFKNLREKYHLDESEDEKKQEEPVKTFYNPDFDTEIEDFFNEKSKKCEEKAEEYMDVEEDDIPVSKENVEEIKASETKPSDIEWDDSIVLDFSKTINKNKDNFEDISSSNEILENINETVKTNDEESFIIHPEMLEEATQIVGEIPVEEDTIIIDNSKIVEEKIEEPVIEADEEPIVENEGLEENPEESIDWDDMQSPKEIKKEMKRLKKENKKKNKRGIFPKKGDSVCEVIRKIILIISILVIIGSSAWIINDLVIQPYLAKKTNESVTNIIDDTNFDAMSNQEKEISHKELLAKNKEYVGWLTVTGGDVSLPVVKSSDNNKYLHRSFYLKYLYAGTLFIDARNSGLNDRNVIIYGHNMNNGSMFGNLKRYKNANAEFYKKNPYITFNTIYGNYKYQIYAVYLADGSGVNDSSFISQSVKTDFSNESFLTYLTAVKKKAYYDTGVTVDENDRIITLVTCDRTRLKNGRLIIVGKLVEES